MDRLSKSQINKLGERLRGGSANPEDQHLLDTYGRSFAQSYEEVARRLRALNLGETFFVERYSKSKMSIVEKLKREPLLKLSEMQDIAGCRIVVADIAAQEKAVNEIMSAFSGDSPITLRDRRIKPSHGYRAVHLIVRKDGKKVEIQVRTRPQHWWAECCEKLAGLYDQKIKYGGGPSDIQAILALWSDRIQEAEEIEAALNAYAASGESDPRLVELIQRNEFHRMQLDELLKKTFSDVVRELKR